MPVSTCRMAHLSLPNSELHVGMGAVGNPRLEVAVHAPGTAVLFPGDGATDARALQQPVRTLVVVDGTWSNARKLVERCPLLRQLPRVALQPDRPGNYRIRREPAAHCLATIEAVAQVLELLEHAPGRFTPILAAFDRMVEFQLTHAATQSEASRYYRARRRTGSSKDAVEPLRSAADRLVLAHGEANWWPPTAGMPGDAELVQWLALHWQSGTRFEALVAPRRPLGPRVPDHIGLPADVILRGEDIERFHARWRQFLPSDAVLVTWGRYARELLVAEQGLPLAWIDLKAVVGESLRGPTGGVERLAQALGRDVPATGRSARRLNAMKAVVTALLSGEDFRALKKRLGSG